MADYKDPENTLIMETSKGSVVIECLPDLAPDHVNHIKELVREGFYEGVVFHRVIDGFMAQGGDPTGTGTGGSSKPNLKAEFNSEPHVRGVCSMARSSHLDSANSQFFICFSYALTTLASLTGSTRLGAALSMVWIMWVNLSAANPCRTRTYRHHESRCRRLSGIKRR